MTNATELQTQVAAGETRSQGFDEIAVARTAETSTTALAAQATAAVNARHIMAMQRPRDLAVARQKLLNDCKRPKFAEVAIYHKPIGQGVEGPSIRMAEAAARAMGNFYADIAAIYDDKEKRIVRVSVTDLESNVTYPLDVTLAKTIERNKPQPGRRVVDMRKNSKGYDVFVIEATDEEILDKERALTSKAMRTNLLRLIPGDILEEAMEQCYATRRGEIAKDPSAARKKMVDAYDGLGINAAQLAEYLGHPLDTTNESELDRMRGLYQAIRDKETTWAEVVDQKRNGTPATNETKPAADVGSRLAEKAAKANAATKQSPAETPPKDPDDALFDMSKKFDRVTGEVHD